jgi:hypothetical protein
VKSRRSDERMVSTSGHSKGSTRQQSAWRTRSPRVPGSDVACTKSLRPRRISKATDCSTVVFWNSNSCNRWVPKSICQAAVPEKSELT